MELPAEVVKTLETKPRQTGIEYEVFRQFVVNVSSGSTEVAISLTNTNEQFVSGDTFVSVVVAKNVSTPTDPAGLVGRALNVDIDVTQDSGKKAVYTFDTSAFPAGITDTLTLKIIAPVSVINAKAKRKIAYYDEVITVAQADAQEQYISLGKADVLSVKSIILDPGGRNVNITKEFEFDNGQRDNMYDIAKVKRRNNSGPLTVTCRSLSTTLSTLVTATSSPLTPTPLTVVLASKLSPTTPPLPVSVAPPKADVNPSTLTSATVLTSVLSSTLQRILLRCTPVLRLVVPQRTELTS